MGLFDTQVEDWYNLMPEEVEHKIKAGNQKFDFENGDYANEQDLKEIFEFVQLLIFDRRLENMVLTLNSIKPHIERAVNQNPDNDNFLEYLIEWNILAMRFVLPDKKYLAELPFYVEIKHLTADKDGIFRAKELQTRLNILNYYKTWREGGGNPECLSNEDAEVINDILENTETLISEQVAHWKENGNITPALIVLRGLYRFYQLQEKPNEAIKILKEILEILPLHTAFTPTDTADVNAEIGMIFYRYKKFATAIPYLEKACQTYEEAGEDYEMHFAQVESFLTECRQKAQA
jgi:tetratricopeptide (TPR) repeat protein